MKRLPATLRTDLLMLPVFVAVVATGFGFHISGHKGVEASITVWKNLHIVFSVSFAMLAAIHIKQHWVWYRNQLKSFNHRNTLTLLLTAVAVFELLSGVTLMTDMTCGLICAHLHRVIGELLSILAIIHIAGRWKSIKFIIGK